MPKVTAAKKKVAAKQKPSEKGAAKKAKNSLVGNINRRKQAGTSRKKQDSTISTEAYSDMQKDWAEKDPAPKKRKSKAG